MARSLSQATLEAIAAAVAQAMAAQAPARTASPVIVPEPPTEDNRTAKRRERAAGGRCPVHGKAFAYASGLKWHMEHVQH